MSNSNQTLPPVFSTREFLLMSGEKVVINASLHGYSNPTFRMWATVDEDDRGGRDIDFVYLVLEKIANRLEGREIALLEAVRWNNFGSTYGIIMDCFVMEDYYMNFLVENLCVRRFDGYDRGTFKYGSTARLEQFKRQCAFGALESDDLAKFPEFYGEYDDAILQVRDFLSKWQVERNDRLIELFRLDMEKLFGPGTKSKLDEIARIANANQKTVK